MATERTIFDRLREMRPTRARPLSALIVEACDVGDELIAALEALNISQQNIVGGEADNLILRVPLDGIRKASAALDRAFRSNGDTPTNGAKAA